MPEQFNPDPLLLPGRSPADPAQAAGFLGGGAANFLGISDAVKALHGQMTPEEAQQFALLAGVSMVPGMRGEGMAARELAAMGKAGAAWNPSKAHPFTETPPIMYGMENPGNYSQASNRTLAKVGKIGTDPDDGWATGKAMMAWVQAHKNAAQDALKTATAGPSTPWKPMDPAGEKFPEHITTMDVPDYLPTPIPERAKAAGFNVPLAHGTKADTPFEEFKLPEEKHNPSSVFPYPRTEIGIHAGSPKAANRFGGHELYSYWDKPRVYPLVMKAQNPLEMTDLGNWGPDNIADFLENHPEFGTDAVSAALQGKEAVTPRSKGAVAQMQALRDLIRSKGYDSIKYKNAVEDPGHTSYIALDPKQLRSPWAKFQDLESRNLLAGLAGGAVAAPALTPNVQEYVKALNK